MKKILVLTLIAFLTLNCSGDDDAEISSTILGQWNWIKSTGGIAGITYTPKSTGENRKIIISSDSIKYFTNGDLISKIKYTIELRDVYNEPHELIVPEHLGIIQFFELDKNKLILTDYCNDCFVSEYVKE
ncbi:hypothetical protein [Gelidibacter sp. F63206]|uniref:hypothetical protein n=1 Tax=Gelidibacter sp. F63206 TaxID=2926425 RepID=UPI001FF3B14A|nr:hypothetical protein [Gelidibacter sp. F63206]MCK0114814.1 hypothetical protein [Gelidibacter sp. F63206]